MLKHVARRLLTMIPLLLGVVLFAQLLVELMPGDPAEIMAGENASPEAIAAIREELRLEDPVWQRFGGYVWDVVRGDLGESPTSDIGVWDQISARLPVTLSLALVALLLATIFGVLAGTVAALHRDRFLDRLVTIVSAVAQAVPPFVVGLGLVILFAVDRSWFPATGYVGLADPGQWFRHLVLPGSTLALVAGAQVARQTRGALVDTLEQDYIRAARARGLPARSLIAKHAAKSAATPVVTVLGLQVGSIVGGAVVVELIFGMPGFGQLALNAVLIRDIPVIQGMVLVSAVAMLLSNLVVDLSYGYFNPRIRT